MNTEPIVQDKVITIKSVEDYTNSEKVFQLMIEHNANSIIIDINADNSSDTELESRSYYSLAEKIEIKGNYFTKIRDKCFANTDILLKEIVISNYITEIGEEAFKNSRIETFQSDSITKANNNVFENCIYLKSISMNSLKAVPNSFAYKCYQLEKIIMKNVTEISSFAFCECISLSQFEFGKVTSFGNSCFQKTSLKKLTIPKECTIIGDAAFRYSLLEIIEFEGRDNVLTISSNAFSNTQLINIQIPDNVKMENIFQECFKIKTIILSDSIKTVTKYFASRCYSLEKVTAPGVSLIQDHAFYFCKNLKSVTFGSVTSFGSNSFAYCKELEFKIPETTNESTSPLTIEEKAFFYCKKIKASSIYCLKIGQICFAGCQSITSLSIYTQEIGTSAFHYCSSLKSIKIYPIPDRSNEENISDPGFNFNMSAHEFDYDDEQISYFVIYQNAFSNCSNLEDVQFIKVNDKPIERRIHDHAFAYTGKIKEIDLSLFKLVSHRAFQSSKIQNVIVGDVDEFCFSNCTFLTKIVVSNKSTKFDATAFSDCVNAKFEFPLPRNNIISENNFIIDKDKVILSLSSFTNEEKIIIPAQYTNIAPNAFLFAIKLKEIVIENSSLPITSSLSNIPSLKKISFPSKMQVYSISSKSFRNDYSLEEIELPSFILTIGDQAFYNCSSLEKITIQNKVYSIGKYAFYNCISLESIVIPSSVKSIGSNAFERCISLVDIDLSMINVLSESILSQCTNLYSVKISTNLISIESYAFKQTYLKSFDIPDSVRSIGENIFYSCSNLNSVTIGKGITTLNNLFKLSAIKEFHIPLHITQINVKCFEEVPYIHVTIDENHPVFYIKDNFIIRKVDNALICTFGELPKTIQIPDEIEQIYSITLNQRWEKETDGFGGEFYDDYDKLPNVVILPESFMNGIPNEILGIKLVCYKGSFILGVDDGKISSGAEISTEYDATDKYPSNRMFDKEILGHNCDSKNIISSSKWRHINGMTTLEITLIVITVLLFFVVIGFFIMYFNTLRKTKNEDSDYGMSKYQF